MLVASLVLFDKCLSCALNRRDCRISLRITSLESVLE